MDLIGKTLVKSQVSGLSKSIGLSGDDNDEQPAYDYEGEQKDDERQAKEKAKREDNQVRKKAERAEERNKMREKYGLKQSKEDKKILETRDQLVTTTTKEGGNTNVKSKRKDDSGCVVM